MELSTDLGHFWQSPLGIPHTEKSDIAGLSVCWLFVYFDKYNQIMQNKKIFPENFEEKAFGEIGIF